MQLIKLTFILKLQNKDKTNIKNKQKKQRKPFNRVERKFNKL